MCMTKRCNVKPIGIIDNTGKERRGVHLKHITNEEVCPMFPEQGYYYRHNHEWVRAAAVLWGEGSK